MRNKRPSREASLWMLASGVFFFASYGFANWMAARRASVPSIQFGWERVIPFVPWTIIPYWSIDLLYAVSFYLCATRAELHTHIKRILAAQMICVAVFLTFPLRHISAAPNVTGALAPWFYALLAFDMPFNQAPSLHVALAAILWAKYSTHLRGAARMAMRAWLMLTAISTLTTYQHHFIDLPTGLWVGLLALAVFPEEHASELPQDGSLLLGAIYLVAAGVSVFIAVLVGGLAWLLLWPAGSLVLAGASYIAGSSRLLGSGKPVFAVTALLGPYLLAAKLNQWVWTRGEEPAHEIAQGVWLGRAGLSPDLKRFASIVALAPETAVRTDLPCRCVPMLDLVAPSAAKLDAAVLAIEELNDLRPTLVCCALGYSRSASATVAWLIATKKADSLGSAIARVARERRVVLPRAHQRALQAWAQSRQYGE